LFEKESNPREDVMILLEEILDEVQSTVAALVKKAISDCKGTHERNLSAFTAIQKTYWEPFDGTDEKEISFQVLLQRLEAARQKHLEWIKGLQYLNQHAPGSLWGEWKAQFEQWLKALPISQDVPIPETYWATRPEDVLKVRLWKWVKRQRNLFREYGLRIRNRARSFLRRPPLRLPQDHRNIPVHRFLENYISLPMARLLLQEREQVLREVALQLQQLHHATEKMIGELLGLGNRKDLCLAPIPQEIRAQVQGIRARMPGAELYFEDLERLKTNSPDRINDRLGRLKVRLQGAWEYADTLVLPNGAFDERNILERWELMEREVEKSRHAWQVHFQGEQEDWKKDIELSLHQIQSILICIDTVQSLEQKIEEQILPSMKEPRIMITETLRKFQDAELEEGKLKDMILVENRSMVRSLRQHKLPALTDAVVQAQIDKTLENYLSRIKYSTESIPEEHVIMHQPDLHKLRPDSNIMRISLKDLILEEFFSKLSRNHNTLSGEMDQKVQEILRDISELDQIVEFNLEAALDLLQQREEHDSIGDARSVVTEGLGRATLQIDDLIHKNRKVAEISQETLVRMTYEYTRQIQELANNEKIIELKIRVARAKAKERIRDYRGRVLKNVKTALPFILSASINFFRPVQTGYLRFRKMTGLAPATAKIEEPLTQFIAERQNQIAALPYVYQRLFRIEPLTDERFFDGRTEVMKALKDEFETRGVGYYGVVALVGEKGSGRTTLLNFAARRIYSKWPCLKMNLKEMTLRTEKGLFMALKDIFKAENIESMDALETHINEQPSQRILIVEDLQNLFIRTVDGFDILERFLLFVSRTHKRVYWIISCSLYSWQYLDKVIQISKYFKRTIVLGQLSKTDIENIILKRHRVSGYKLHFEIPEKLRSSRRFRKQTSERELQSQCKNLLFEQLDELGAGNITVTMLFWLSAIKRIEKDTLILSPLIEIDYTVFYRFSPEELFTLSALIQHDALNAEEHAEIFHQEIRQSLLLLNRMSNKGILAGNTDGSYKINPLLYRLVVEYLKTRNILH
jgi:hypothetical protein